MEPPTPEYKVGDHVYDDVGNDLGVVVHCSYNETRKLWSYTIADSKAKGQTEMAFCRHCKNFHP